MNENLYIIDSKKNLLFKDMVRNVEKSANKITYYYNENYILGKTVQYEIFKGIWIVYHDLELKNSQLFPMEKSGFIRLNYCISGRCEMDHKNHCVFYIGAGDFIAAFLSNENYRHNFPLNRYKGMAITTTEKSLDKFLNNIFGDSRITSSMLVNKINGNGKYITLSNNIAVKNIMEEMKMFDSEFWEEKAIVKFAELILLLINMDLEAYDIKSKYFDRCLVNKVKLIKKDVIKRIDSHVTIEEISKKYSIAKRTFSECFKEIYGKTYYAFIKEFRVKKGAEMLSATSNTIGQVAITVGYQNASKFSKAFYDIMGVNPRDFRKDNLTAVLE